MNTNIFPLHFNCSDKYGWADCPLLAKSIWMRIRLSVAPKLGWYAVAIKLLSTSEMKLYVYDMADSFQGGIGQQVFVHEISRDELIPGEVSLLDSMLLKAYSDYAENELCRRETAERALKIKALRQELFGC